MILASVSWCVYSNIETSFILLLNHWCNTVVGEKSNQISCVISSPEPKAQWWAYRIGKPFSSLGVRVVCMSTFSNIFSEHRTDWSQPNFMWSLLGTGEQKFVQTVQVTWPRWLPCPYLVKTLKNLLLRNQKADDLEPWYAALGAQVLTNLFKLWIWVDLDLFYGKVKFGPLCFCMGKRENNGYFRSYCSLWCQSW